MKVLSYLCLFAYAVFRGFVKNEISSNIKLNITVDNNFVAECDQGIVDMNILTNKMSLPLACTTCLLKDFQVGHDVGCGLACTCLKIREKYNSTIYKNLECA